MIKVNKVMTMVSVVEEFPPALQTLNTHTYKYRGDINK